MAEEKKEKKSKTKRKKTYLQTWQQITKNYTKMNYI